MRERKGGYQIRNYTVQIDRAQKQILKSDKHNVEHVSECLNEEVNYTDYANNRLGYFPIK